MEKFKITKEDQIKELISRIPPVLNVDIVIIKEDGSYLVGKRNKEKSLKDEPKLKGKGKWLFPGSRMKYTESPQDTALRVLKNETPGIKAQLKKIITVTSDQGNDSRAHGVTLFYLFEYISGTPKPNFQLEKFAWVTREEFLKMPRAYLIGKSIVNEIDLAIRTRNSSEDELLVEVDKDNKEIGVIVKRDAHSSSKRYHRAAHIMIFTSKGDIVLHKRSLTKSTGAGKWDMLGGHQSAGLTIEQTARHELAEELGSSAELHFSQIGLNRLKEQSEYYYLYWGIDDGPYGFDRNEVMEVKVARNY
jgi:ADP-ribose pyrophosphatase YjhB (NUDIX family)